MHEDMVSHYVIITVFSTGSLPPSVQQLDAALGKNQRCAEKENVIVVCGIHASSWKNWTIPLTSLQHNLKSLQSVDLLSWGLSY